MAAKIMLVIDNKDDQDFMEKVLLRLKYDVISMKNGRDLSEQLIDHFPDVVFASTLGRNAKILNALGKIKEVRGKPKLVFVKMKNEKHTLTPTQKEIIDGTIYTPVDPFKLIDLLAQTTDIDKIELRRRYNEMLESDRGTRGKTNKSGVAEDSEDAEARARSMGDSALSAKKNKKSDDYGQTQVIGKHHKSTKTEVQNEDPDYYGTVNPGDFSEEEASTRKRAEGESSDTGKTSVEEEVTSAPGHNVSQDADSETRQSAGPDESAEVEKNQEQTKNQKSNSLLHDPSRKRKYDEITAKLKANGEQPKPMDVQRLREKQRAQAQEVSEDETIKKNRKHFLKTLFSISPESVSKK